MTRFHFVLQIKFQWKKIFFQDGDDDSGSPQKTVIKNENETEAATNKQQGQDIPLQENTLLVDISDALSEKDRVKFTVHTKTSLPVSTRNLKFFEQLLKLTSSTGLCKIRLLSCKTT